jgi:hypothetical protein
MLIPENKMAELAKTGIIGHCKITDDLGNVLVDKYNSIHYENMSIALAKSLAHKPDGTIYTMWFGNGGATVSGSGQISYLPPRVSGSGANLYNPTYYKVIDNESSLNTNIDLNNMTIQHTSGALYTDIVIACTLDFGEPASQAAFDNATDLNATYVFSEIGLKTFNTTPSEGLLVTHLIFSPVQKSLNRKIAILYTIRIQNG